MKSVGSMIYQIRRSVEIKTKGREAIDIYLTYRITLNFKL